jgi:hypothetical protein
MSYTEAEVDACMCVWDELLDRRRGLPAEGYRTPQERAFDKYWDACGYAVMRSRARYLGMWAQEIWMLLSEEQQEDGCFDFELVPRMLDLIDWEYMDVPPAAKAMAILFPATPTKEA